jgi:hypothetical protein
MAKKLITKTFKIGEYCKGGIITVEIQNEHFIDVIHKEWDYSAGSTRGSDQSNAKEISRERFLASNPDVEFDIELHLQDLTTSYYAGQIVNWLKSKVSLA